MGFLSGLLMGMFIGASVGLVKFAGRQAFSFLSPRLDLEKFDN